MAGRYSKYDTNVKPYLEMIEAWTRDGATEAQLCERLDVCQDSFIQYKKQNAELVEVLKKGREATDIQVENALLKRALGFTYEEVTQERIASGDVVEMQVTKIVRKQVVPDVGAQAFWLKNRRPDVWKERQETGANSKGDNKIEITFKDLTGKEE